MGGNDSILFTGVLRHAATAEVEAAHGDAKRQEEPEHLSVDLQAADPEGVEVHDGGPRGLVLQAKERTREALVLPVHDAEILPDEGGLADSHHAARGAEGRLRRHAQRVRLPVRQEPLVEGRLALADVQPRSSGEAAYVGSNSTI